MTEFDYDVLYLGSGHATFDGALPLAERGFRIGVIEADRIGGTCPNWGCNAKVALDEPVTLQRELERMHGTVAASGQIDWPKNQAHKQTVIEDIPAGLADSMEAAGIDLIFGKGRLVDAHTIEVAGRTYQADKLVIATGMHPHILDIPGKEYLHDSTDFLALKKMPKQITIIGGGYIALESATLANAAGSDVTVLLHHDRVLRAFDPAFVDLMVADLKKRGVRFIKSAQPKAVTAAASNLQVHTAAGIVTTDWILDASGRIANTKGLGLAELGIETNEDGIVVNDYLQTTVPNIYASGDVLSKDVPKLTPTAMFESRYLMHLFAGDEKTPIRYPAIATTVFTSPRIAQAGVDIATAQANPAIYRIVERDLKQNWYRQVSYEDIAKVKLIFNQQNQLVGVTEISEQAVDVVNSLLPAIEFGFTPDQLERIINIFPSISASAYSKLA